MSQSPFDASALFRSVLPAPVPLWKGMAAYTFDSGHNDPDLIPLDELAQAAQRVIHREGRSLAVYNQGTGPQGYAGLRRFVSHKLSGRGITASPDDILITSGSGPALDLINNALVEPGDTVLVEAFSYAGALRKLRERGANLIGVPLDEEGMRADALEENLASLAAQGIRPKYIYTIPTVQNPTGAIQSLARRQHIIELAQQYQTLIVEDECYADIVWQEDTPPALYALQPDQVIHVSSFSKTLAPSVRVAYVTALPAILRQLIALKNDGGTGALDQMIVAEYFSEHFDRHITRLRAALKVKLDVLVEAVKDELGDKATLWLPKGGIFLWLQLPEGIDTRDFLQEAAVRGVAYNPGPDWAADADGAGCWLRLCFALASAEEIRQGVAALADVIRRQPAWSHALHTQREAV